MIANRSIPGAVVIPELAYPDVGQAADWLCQVFGFRKRLIIGNHRIQLHVGEGGAVVVIEKAPDTEPGGHSLLIRVNDARAHHEIARGRGATILRAPADHPYGECQYTARDCGGHVWTFSQSLADVDPASWGGQLIEG